jgi:hypothetical protein
MRALKVEIASQIPGLEPSTSKAKINGVPKNGANYVLKFIGFYDHINTITEMGCVLKDVDSGLTDFLSFR